MEEIKISTKKLKQLELFSPEGLQNISKFFVWDEHTLLKIFPYYLLPNLPERLVRNIKIGTVLELDHCCYPQQICRIDGIIRGYTVPKLEHITTWEDSILYNELTLEEKIKIVEDVFVPIKQLHRLGIVIGDIHLNNMLYQEIDDSYQGILCDLDEIHIDTIEFPTRQLYWFWTQNHTKEIRTPSIYTDNIKATICALSFIEGINYEKLLRDDNIYHEEYNLESSTNSRNTIDIDALIKILNNRITNQEFLEATIDILQNISETDTNDSITYFDEILPKLLANQKTYHK